MVGSLRDRRSEGRRDRAGQTLTLNIFCELALLTYFT